MSIINFLFGTKPKSSSVAKDRLQIIIAQERVQTKIPDYLPTLEIELLELLSKYVVNVSTDDIKIKHEKKEGVSILELNITIPEEINPKVINKNLKPNKTVKKLKGYKNDTN